MRICRRMDNLKRAMATLLIYGDELVPDELTALLGAPPKLGVRRGESFVGHQGNLITAKTGRWDVGTGWREPPCIDKMICEVLHSLAEGTELWRDLTTRFDCYLSVGLYFYDDSWTGGITLEPQTLRMLGERGLALDLDMYAPGASN